LFRRLGHETGLNAALVNSAWAAFELGDLDAAERAFGESLVIVDRLALRPVLASTAVAMAAILVAKGAAGRAARMLGAAAALREELGTELNDELEHRTQAQAIADAKVRLGDDRFASAWAQGQAMTPEEMSHLWRDD